MKNITFSADEGIIQKARAKAKKSRTTLNKEFRKWLKEYSQDRSKSMEYRQLMKELKDIKLSGPVSRDEMNER